MINILLMYISFAPPVSPYHLQEHVSSCLDLLYIDYSPTFLLYVIPVLELYTLFL